MTRTLFAMALLAAAVLGVVGVVWMTHPRGGGNVAQIGSGAQTAADAPQPLASTAHPTTLPRHGASPTQDDLGAASTRALRDPAYLRELMRQYASEVDVDRRGAVLSILQSAANDDVLRFARQLIDSRDRVARQEGLALLSAYPLDRAEVRTLLVEQIRGETDPAMQKQLVEMLTPAVVSIEDAAPVLEQLAALRDSPDPDVRAASLLQTAQWDKSGDVEGLLSTAILDPDTRVRQAAIAGVTTTNLRSDRLRDALLDIASNPRADAGERQAAIFALQNFALDRSQYAIYKQASEGFADHD